jgi:hypothetical protein
MYPLHLISEIHTGCPRRSVSHFGRVFLMLKYTDITQNTYVQNWTYVYMNFFDQKDLGNHLLKLCPKVVKHPVYI